MMKMGGGKHKKFDVKSWTLNRVDGMCNKRAFPATRIDDGGVYVTATFHWGGT